MTAIDNNMTHILQLMPHMSLQRTLQRRNDVNTADNPLLRGVRATSFLVLASDVKIADNFLFRGVRATSFHWEAKSMSRLPPLQRGKGYVLPLGSDIKVADNPLFKGVRATSYPLGSEVNTTNI